MSESISYNRLTVEEAIQALKDNNIKVLEDTVVFYIQYVDEVDEKPDQLIGIESEDSLIEELNRNYIDVVAVGEEVINIEVGDKFYINPKILMSSQDFSVNGLKYGFISERVIKIIKKA